MTKELADRLRNYYVENALAMLSMAKAASIFSNTTDIGISREKLYADFLTRHLPQKSRVFLGGALFDDNCIESNQLDIIITNDTSPSFNSFYNNGYIKSYAHVEGTLGVASIKSTLDKKELFNALKEVASIPLTNAKNAEPISAIKLNNYDDWPLKIIYATDGIDIHTLNKHLDNFYAENRDIPLCRRPNYIHVSGKYFIRRATENSSSYCTEKNKMTTRVLGSFLAYTKDPDLQAISSILNELQNRTILSSFLLFSYHNLFNKIIGIPDDYNK